MGKGDHTMTGKYIKIKLTTLYANQFADCIKDLVAGKTKRAKSVRRPT